MNEVRNGNQKGIHIYGIYVVHHKLYAFFIYVLCIFKNWKVGQNRILYCFQNSTTIRHGVLISGYVELIPTAVSSNWILKIQI